MSDQAEAVHPGKMPNPPGLDVTRPNVSQVTAVSPAARIMSIDALRGFVMFMMIFVNDLAGAGKVVPNWMVHFSDRHRGGSGMTFVDLVFPAFLFLVGMSIPFALGGRLAKGEPVWRMLGHVLTRTLALLAIGILMVHETPDSNALGWSGNWWCTLMYLSAIAAFCSIAPGGSSPSSPKAGKRANLCVRVIGLAMLVWLAFAFRGANDQRIISLSPLSLNTKWYGILGLIGWAYLVTAIVFSVFRTNRTALLGSMALLLCLFAAERTRAFEGFWLAKIVGIGGTLGSLPAIAAGGCLLGAMLATTGRTDVSARTRFTVWFVLGCGAAALLLEGSYGISKNQATPSWCLWSCAITASLWYLFFMVSDVRPVRTISRPLALAGRNVLLAYLISEMLPGLLEALHWGDWYGNLATSLGFAITRSVVCGILILFASTGLNRIGFWLKL